jgi:hypothetical protein
MSSSSSEAPRCRYIKVSGTQCGSPALRDKNFCFYHQQHRPIVAECYAEEKYSTGEILLPAFEDAHSIQSVIRKTVQMLLQKRIERKTASLLLYALQIASSNLKRMELEKPQPEQVVLDTVIHEKWESPIAPMQEAMPEKKPEKEPEKEKEKVKENEKESQAKEVSATAQPDSEPLSKEDEADLPPGTIQACYQPPDHSKDKSKDKKDARRSRVAPSAGQSTNWWDMSFSKRIH